MKKKIRLEACLQKIRHFSPFFSSVNGLMDLEAMATQKRITSRLATKCRQTYSRIFIYVKRSITITLVRATHWCIQGSRVTAHMISVQRLQWEDGSKINIFR